MTPLPGIKTPDEFFNFLQEVAKQSRLLQPLSSEYFIEETGEMKIFAGVQKFLGAETMEVDGLKPRVDSKAFSMLAWVQLRPGQGVNVIRKPLGSSPEEFPLSCWGWYVGHPADRFTFGAHDFRGTAFGSQESAAEEGVECPSAVADGKLHMVAVVINQTTVSFYTDAKLQKLILLDRPVTDCSGNMLIAGADNVPRLGEITFFPRVVPSTEMEEIMSAGFSFESLASGKEAYNPTKTPFDVAGAVTSNFFADARGERAQAAIELQVENAFGRLISDIVANPPADLKQDMAANSKLVVPEKANCFMQPIFKVEAMSCRMMSNISQYDTCPFTGDKKYINLIQPPYLPSGHRSKDRVLLDNNYPKQYLHFDPTSFPSFCGKSATFSMWVENWDCGARATLLARYPKTVTTATAEKASEPSKRVKGSWFYQIDQDSSSGGTKCCIGQIPGDGIVAYWKCAIVEPKLNCMPANSRRHLALVMDKDDNSIKFYIDGTLAKSLSSELPLEEKWIDDNDEFGGGVARLDCHMNTSESYSPVGHRIGSQGEKPYVGPIQVSSLRSPLNLFSLSLARVCACSEE